MREGGELAPQFRVLTDATGPFFTVVTEVEVESLTRLGGGVPGVDEPPLDGGVVQPDDAAGRVLEPRVLQHYRVVFSPTGQLFPNVVAHFTVALLL